MAPKTLVDDPHGNRTSNVWPAVGICLGIGRRSFYLHPVLNARETPGACYLIGVDVSVRVISAAIQRV